MKSINKLFASGVLVFLMSACNSVQVSEEPLPEASLRQQLAQKLILDFRYYCQQADAESKSCRTPLTKLPFDVASVIAETDLGGVILFSDNLVSVEQIVELNHALANTAQHSKLGLPLFISVDQEGGRVARLPRADSTAFTGSMSIAATYPVHGTKYAELTGKILANELKAVGFNLNYAPTVDVNINPNNPVINVRSFGEDPQVVSHLATAQLDAMQQNGLLGTLKHFPGHGDTSVDSHTGLPRVEHDLAKVKQVDLAPFQHAIDKQIAQVIMTAHIQYPQLDNSTFFSKTGQEMIKPATMSKAILTDLLRGELNYQGLIVTDALDMKGISQFFNSTEAVIQTFKAGADIALMPIAIRNKQDLNKLQGLLNELERAVEQGVLDRNKVFQSYQRIVAAKRQLPALPDVSLQDKIAQAKAVLATPESKQIENALAEASLTLLKGSGELQANTKHVHLLMPDENKCAALTNELLNIKPSLKVTCSNFVTMDLDQAQQQLTQADAIVVTSITPRQSLAEMGGMDDLPRLIQQMKKSKFNHASKQKLKAQWLSLARQQGKQSLFVSLRMPYEAKQFGADAEHILATYAYNQYENSQGQETGASYRALAKKLLGKIEAKGKLPVTVAL